MAFHTDAQLAMWIFIVIQIIWNDMPLNIDYTFQNSYRHTI